MQLVGQFDPRVSGNQQLNTTVRPGSNAKILFFNLSMDTVLLTFPNSDQAVLAPGHRRVFPTDDWPNGTVTCFNFATAFQNVGQNTTFPVVGSVGKTFVAPALGMVYVELYGQDEDYDVSLPHFIGAQMAISNLLKADDAIGAWAAMTATFSGTTQPSITPTAGPLTDANFYLKGWDVHISPIASGSPRIFTLTLSNLIVQGAGTMSFRYWLNYDTPVADSHEYGYPGLLGANIAVAPTLSGAYTGNLGAGASGSINLWGYWVPLEVTH